ncbi:helix-turn-helix transcriptional regulator [Kitasatospora sp. NPDC097691]|uniref:helix-turn-helix transcriptional regulator n=1 Tax=Kitasatospora sp. NPDC097691 TaxID=3157231 RepID=UPI003318CED7
MDRIDHCGGIRWHWTTPRAQDILRRRALPEILQLYRELHGLPQQELADLLGYSTSYVSRIETGSRTITDIGALRHLADRLDLPPHCLGITDDVDGDHRLVIQLADSVLRLAEIARQSGQATTAVAELWPLVARLEARAADGHADLDALRLLARARVGLGVALGHVLPEERMAAAAGWTGKGLSVARRLDDPALHAHALRHHGNELRKSGLHLRALDRLGQARDTARTATERAEAVVLLARAAGAAGNAAVFDEAVEDGRRLLEETAPTALFSEFTLHEVRLRGLMSTGRVAEAVRQLDQAPTAGLGATSQWRIIAAITAGEVLLRRGDTAGATRQLTTAVDGATLHRLPHQLQRIVRACRSLPAVRDRADDALAQLRADIAA